MAYLSKKLAEEIKLSRKCYNVFAEEILDFNDIKATVLDRIYKDTEDDILEFIGEYENYINKVCNNRKYYLKDESRDCEQVIKLYLCKLYHKRHKYSNFGKVVHSVIKRKAIDFSKARNQDLKGMINETDYIAEAESVSSFIEQHSNTSGTYKANMTGNVVAEDTKVADDFSKDVTDIKFIIDKLMLSVECIEQFTKRDLQIMDKIKECVDKGDCELNNILKKISSNRSKATQEFGFFVGRISKYIDETEYL